MDLAFSPQELAFRDEVRVWLVDNLPEGWGLTGYREPETFEEKLHFARGWERQLADAGWAGISWPKEYGGRGATLMEQVIFHQEMAAARAPMISLNFVGINLAGPTIMAHGSEEQKARYLGKILTLEELWCQGFSEPNAGSDLAGLQTRAELRDDHFVVNGQKVWTSYATIAQKCFCYVRTDPTLPKHKGISLLILDMDTPGIDIRPLRHISGTAGFAEVFFTDVIVPRENLVGGLNSGWAITQRSLAHERAGLWGEGVARYEQTIEGLVTLARQQGRAGDPIIRRKIASAYELAASL